jgi:hypothetical protein
MKPFAALRLRAFALKITFMKINLTAIFQILICLIIGSQLIGCSTDQATGLSQIERNRNLWKEKNVSSYDFEMEHFAEGMGRDWTRTFKVRDRKTLPLESNNGYPPRFQYEDIDSIGKLFDYIQKSETEFNANVRFNKDYGYPEEIRLSAKGGSNAWVSIKIKRLEIVQ